MTDYAYSIFQQPWWLDAVAPDAWAEARVEKGGEVVARLPYIVRKRWGFTQISSPPLTKYLGPWFAPIPGKYANQLSTEKSLAHDLLDQLPPFDLFGQGFHPEVTNWFPFYLRHFEQTTHYTYVVDDISDTDAVWSGTLAKIRTDVRKAGKGLVVLDDEPIDTLLDVVAKTYGRQDREMPFGRDLVHRIDAACGSRGQRLYLAARDEHGLLHAGIYVVWDGDRAHYLLGGADPDLRNSGASSLLLWEAIQRLSGTVRSFDPASR